MPLGEATGMIATIAAESKARVKRARIHATPRAIIDPSLSVGRYSSGSRHVGYDSSGDTYGGVI